MNRTVASIHVPLWTADQTPSGMLIANASNIDTSVSLPVFGNATEIECHTGNLLRSDNPRSPVIAWRRNTPYCTMIG